MAQKSYQVKTSKGPITVKVNLPSEYKKGILIANGAGAPMTSPFISFFFKELAGAGYATCCFNFSYQQQGKKSPDRMPLLQEAFKAALQKFSAASNLEERKIILAGKSMGGRVASMLFDDLACPGLVLLGYPLHPPGKKEKLRDEHLYPLKKKCLFISGTRDSLCDLGLLNKVTAKMKNARVYVIESGDHSFKVTKSSGLDQQQVFNDCIKEIRKFVR